MADELISFPFRLDRQGAVAGTPYGSNQEIEEAIAITTMTIQGERPLFPNFGLPSPAFHGLHAADIQTQLEEYGPTEITITEVTETPVSDTESFATINWEYEDETEEEDEF